MNNKIESVNLKSGVTVDYTSNKKIHQSSIGCIHIHSNAVKDNNDYVILYSSCSNLGATISITERNIISCLCLFTSRKCLQHNWINDKDEYIPPNESHPKFKQFQNDSIIYSLFNSSSQQSSLRNITYHNKQWNIKNEFFWISKNYIKQLAEQHNNEQVYNDVIQNNNERYVHTLLQQKLNDSNEPFSEQAKIVLNKANELVELSFPYRKDFNSEHPEYQVNNWDIGWYQIKAICKQHLKDKYDEFRKEYLKLRDELRPLVYELGFLK